MSKPCHSSIESSRESTSSHRDISALDDHQLGMLHQGLSSSSKTLRERWTGHMLFNCYTSTVDISTSLNSIAPSITPTNMAGNIITVSIIVVSSSLSNWDVGTVGFRFRDCFGGICFQSGQRHPNWVLFLLRVLVLFIWKVKLHFLFSVFSLKDSCPE